MIIDTAYTAVSEAEPENKLVEGDIKDKKGKMSSNFNARNSKRQTY